MKGKMGREAQPDAPKFRAVFQERVFLTEVAGQLGSGRLCAQHRCPEPGEKNLPTLILFFLVSL